MIKRDLKDFGYNIKLYKAYMNVENNKCIKDLNKLNRIIWKLRLKEFEFEDASYDEEYSYKLTIKK